MPQIITSSMPALLALLIPNTIATAYTNYMVILDNERFQMQDFKKISWGAYKILQIPQNIVDGLHGYLP